MTTYTIVGFATRTEALADSADSAPDLHPEATELSDGSWTGRGTYSGRGGRWYTVPGCRACYLDEIEARIAADRARSDRTADVFCDEMEVGP